MTRTSETPALGGACRPTTVISVVGAAAAVVTSGVFAAVGAAPVVGTGAAEAGAGNGGGGESAGGVGRGADAANGTSTRIRAGTGAPSRVAGSNRQPVTVTSASASRMGSPGSTTCASCTLPSRVTVSSTATGASSPAPGAAVAGGDSVTFGRTMTCASARPAMHTFAARSSAPCARRHETRRMYVTRGARARAATDPMSVADRSAATKQQSEAQPSAATGGDVLGATDSGAGWPSAATAVEPHAGRRGLEAGGVGSQGETSGNASSRWLRASSWQ